MEQSGEAPRAFLVRPATSDDVTFLADVVIAATRAQGRLLPDFDESGWRKTWCRWTEQQIQGAPDANTTSVIELRGERVGRLRVVRSGDGIELAGMQLSPDVQGRGIGTAIVESLQAEATAAGVAVELGVEKDNPNAHRLYRRLGFEQVGESEAEFLLRWFPTRMVSQTAS